RSAAIVADEAPTDIHSGTRPRTDRLEPLGLSAGRLDGTARQTLDHLVTLYLDRLPEPVAAAEAARIAAGDLHFAWAGPPGPGGRHYYRIQGDDLLIEYDNTSPDGNHAHTVLRRPDSDFGDDVLAAHHTDTPHP
ncbi:DUF3500 domain-containing protein, partial [Micromonospora zhanjiangensis]